MSFIQLPQAQTLTKPVQGSNLDAFGRERVSNPQTVFDNKQLGDTQALVWDDTEVSGGSTSTTYSATKASTTIAVAGTTAGKRVRQTYQRFNYQPGKSQQIMMTGTFVDQSTLTGITAEIGLYDENNGVFFSYEEGTMKAVVRSNVTASPVDTKVSQSEWNTDRMEDRKSVV